MFPDYSDITDRINEPPTWYTKHGVPRYGKYKPREISIYARYSTLMEIGCQSCGERFFIGQDYDDFDIMQSLVDMTKVPDYEYKPADSQIWIALRRASFAPLVKDADGKDTYKTLTIQEIVENWGFGDPPNHHCIGDTMGCVEIRSVEVWDHRFGQEIGPSANGDYNVVKKSGVPTRITELEDYKYEIPEWYHYA